MGKRTSDPTGVIGCTEECKATAMVCMPNHTIVEFRPLTTWRGEFGFDWLRIGDDPAIQHEIKYEDCIRDGYKDKVSDLGSAVLAYNGFKTEYHNLPVNTHRTAPQNEYFIPWLNLYSQSVSEEINKEYKSQNSGRDLPITPPYSAELRLIINVQGDTKPKELEITFPAEYFTITYPGSSATAIPSSTPVTIPATEGCFTANSPGINGDFSDSIKITCIKEFSKNQYIDVWAHHYVHSQTEIDQLKQENQQFNDTDIPALEAEIKTLETENTDLTNEINQLKQDIQVQEAKIQGVKGVIAALTLAYDSQKTLCSNYENILLTDTTLTGDAKQNLQNEIYRLKSDIASRETLIEAKQAEIDSQQEEIDRIQADIRARESKIRENEKLIEDKQTEIDEKRKQITQNTEEMNKMQNRSLAGKLCVCANSSGYRKKVDVVVIKIRLDIHSTGVGSFGRDLSNDEMNAYYNVMYQSLIYPTFTTKKRNSISGVFEDLVLDLRTDANFQTGGAYIDVSSGRFIDDATIDPKYPNQGTHRYLRNKFEKDVGKYPKSIHIFMFGEPSYYPGGVGIVQEIGGPRNFLMTLPIPNPNWAFAVPHETLHCFSLYHTHRDSTPLSHLNQKYVFYHGQSADVLRSTWNIMSYRENSYYTWKWQWDLIHKNIG